MARYNADKVRNFKLFLRSVPVLMLLGLGVFLGGVWFFERHPKLLDIFMASGIIGAISYITYLVVTS